MISVFDVTGQKKLLNLESFLENSTPQSAQYSEQTKQKLENLRAEEKERNEFSEMIEAIVNSKSLVRIIITAICSSSVRDFLGMIWK